MPERLEIFLVALPGLEAALADEARSAGFANAQAVAGGVSMQGSWPDAWRANLELRGPSRVLVRLGAFRAPHLAQLDKRARKFPWGDFLRDDVPVAVEASCKSSRIYHAGAAAERIATAIRESLGAPVGEDARLRIMARIEDDLCTISVDTSGELLHKRGHKLAMAKAPMRETMAALFLRQCGYDGSLPLIDPMCGSGTFVIEAAGMATGQKPGASRNFAFEYLKSFDKAQWEAMRAPAPLLDVAFTPMGFDKDAGAVRMARENAERAGLGSVTRFAQGDIRDLQPPDGPQGLIIINPPYGTRIGDKRGLNALHVTMGRVLRERFRGWRVGIITSDAALARATDIAFESVGAPVTHGGLKVKLYRALIT